MRKLVIPLALSPLLLVFTDCRKKTCDRCELAPEQGPCDAAIVRYYFNQESQTCETFYWGGCEGTVPFVTLAECEAVCENSASD